MKFQFKVNPKQPWWFLLALFTVMVLAMPNAFAAATDTDAGDTISNQATINYSVGSVAQTAVNSNIASFVVDHKVRPLAAWSADDTAVPGGTNEYLTFTVTNDGNTDTDAPATLEIQLTAQEGVNGTEDNIDVVAGSIRIYHETNGTAGLQIPGDTLVTDYSVPSLGYIDLARDTTATVYLVANMPATATDGQTALCHLVATAWDSGVPGALAEDGDGDDPAVVEVVWADDAGSLPAGDGVFNGLHSASATFTIGTATLAVTKSSSVVTDPFGSQYRVPGAQVQYTIDITNNGSADAESVVITDTIPANTAFYVGSVVGGAAAYSNDNGTSWVYVPVAGANGEDPNVTDVQVTLGANVTSGGGTAQVTFDVLID